MAGEAGAKGAFARGGAPSLKHAWGMPSLGLLGLGPNPTSPDSRQTHADHPWPLGPPAEARQKCPSTLKGARFDNFDIKRATLGKNRC